MKNPLIEKFGDDARWVNFRIEEVEGRKTKVPMFSKGKKASSTDPKTWKTYEEATNDANNGSNGFDGVGIVFKEDRLLLGIDIDHCLLDGKIHHPQAKKIVALIDAAKTYTEISPSGDGLHLFLAFDSPFVLEGNRKAPFELYNFGRYFTVTENVFGSAKQIRLVTNEEAKEILSTIEYPWASAPEEVKEDDKKEKKTAPSSGGSVLTDEEVVSKMTRKDEVKALYNGDISKYENDDSRADMALLSHLAFWTRKDKVQMDRIWLASPLGNREKTQKTKVYRIRSINKAIELCENIYELPQQALPELDLLYTLNKDKDKIYTLNTENIVRVLRNHKDFRNRLRFESFKNKIQIDLGDGEWEDIEDNHILRLQTRISVVFPCFGKIKKDMVNDAVLLVCKENIYDSAKVYLTSIKWDGTPRLANWISKTYGTPDDEYHQKVGENWFKGLVKRLMVPGCKFDYVLVLEGAQGIKKSTSLAVIGRDWHLETMKAPDNKDFFQDMSGKAIVEFSEGESMSRVDIKRLKAVITTQVDTYRPSYGRFSQDFPRRCVFAMTTNQSEYLKDETGNRRWLPVTCTKVADIEWLEENRDQLYAEAYDRVINKKESTWDFPEEETRRQQDARRIEDANTEMIVDWYMNTCSKQDKINGLTSHQVYMGAFQGNNSFSSKGMSKSQQMSITDVLKRTLKLVKKQKMEEGVRIVRWYQEGLMSEIDEYLAKPIEVQDISQW